MLLMMAGVAQRVVPMPRWSRIIGEPAQVPEQWASSHEETLPVRSASRVEDRVRRAVRRGGSRLPWTPSCLAEAAAGQIMLRRRGACGVVVIGLRPRPDKERWESHAWLLGAMGALTGGPAAQGFTAVSVFEVPGGLRAVDVDLTGPEPPEAADW